MPSRYENLMKPDDAAFRRITGTKQCVFEKMLGIVHFFHFLQHKQGGAPNKIPLADKRLITLQYWREYRTLESIGADYGVNRSTILRIVEWVESMLHASGQFVLPAEESLTSEEMKDKTVIIDVTESPVQCPKKGQKDYYSGNKKDIPSKHNWALKAEPCVSFA